MTMVQTFGSHGDLQQNLSFKYGIYCFCYPGVEHGHVKKSSLFFLNMVGGFKHVDYFPFHIWDVILPIDELIFFRGVGQPPTSFS